LNWWEPPAGGGLGPGAPRPPPKSGPGCNVLTPQHLGPLKRVTGQLAWPPTSPFCWH